MKPTPLDISFAEHRLRQARSLLGPWTRLNTGKWIHTGKAKRTRASGGACPTIDLSDMLEDIR